MAPSGRVLLLPLLALLQVKAFRAPLLPLLLAPAASMEVKVFILAGQSNMEGHGVATKAAGANDGNGTVEWSAGDASWKDLPVCKAMEEPVRAGCRAEGVSFDGLVDDEGNFTVYDDAFVVFEGSASKRGNLTIGYGFQDAWVGPEYGMGLSLRSLCDDDTKVLLLKWAYGGTDLEHDWRPPSSGAPPSEGGVGPYGWCYRNMTEVVQDVVANQLSDVVPGFDYASDTSTIAGFAWHQGWNDGCDETCTADYEANLVNLIGDVRSEFGVADLPVSIGLSGFGGWGQANDRRLGIMRAQYNVSTYVDNVGTVETRGFFRDFDETNGAINQGYHWFGNGETYVYVGTAMAAVMTALLDGSWVQPYINTSMPDAPGGKGCGVFEDGATCAW